MKTLTILLTIACLVGCTSTIESEQISSAPAEVKNKMNTGDPLTDKELSELAATTSFTTAQLKKAAKELGYRCTYSLKTGSRIKTKTCSTQEQRDVRVEAAKRYAEDMRYGPAAG